MRQKVSNLFSSPHTSFHLLMARTHLISNYEVRNLGTEKHVEPLFLFLLDRFRCFCKMTTSDRHTLYSHLQLWGCVLSVTFLVLIFTNLIKCETSTPMPWYKDTIMRWLGMRNQHLILCCRSSVRSIWLCFIFMNKTPREAKISWHPRRTVVNTNLVDYKTKLLCEVIKKVKNK